jgi:hypothetical protein
MRAQEMPIGLGSDLGIRGSRSFPKWFLGSKDHYSKEDRGAKKKKKKMSEFDTSLSNIVRLSQKIKFPLVSRLLANRSKEF